MHDDADGICDNCTAPKQAGRATCRYCGRPFVADLVRRAVECVRCKTWNDWGAVQCVQCQAPVVTQCLFCSALSPLREAACLRCKEPFAGAAERFAERKAAEERDKTLKTVAAVGSVAAGVLGVAARSGALGAIASGLGDLLDDD